MAGVKQFYNVYAHVPTENQVKRVPTVLSDQCLEERYTGVIQVLLRTRTPIFTPDTEGRRSSKGEEAKHQIQNFFTYDGKNPVIPGSSLRGVLRNIHEAASNSCYSVVDLDDKPVKRTNEYYKAGLLYRDANGNITLYEAKKATVKRNVRPDLRGDKRAQAFKEGAVVYSHGFYNAGKQHLTRDVKLESEMKKIPVRQIQEWTKGYYFKGEPGVSKAGECQNAYVFYFVDEKSVKANMNKKSEEMQELLDVLASYEKNAADVKKRIEDYTGYEEYRQRLNLFFGGDLEYFPVHYSEMAGKIYLSPACITKEIYYTNILSILEKQGGHDTCRDFKNLCPTCTLFGMVGENSSEKSLKEDYPNAWASSVRVQDAVLKEGQKDVFGKQVCLMELASPKKSSTEFYLQKPQKEGESILSWTYDYYVSQKGNGKPKVKAYTPKIAGRKFYWHHQIPNLPGKEYVDEDNPRSCTVTPVKENIEFIFPVYFEKVTKEQLDQLIWICSISQKTKKNGQGKEEAVYGYKVGKGKPLGLGSCEFHVTDVKIRSLKDKEGNISYGLKNYDYIFGRNYREITYEAAGFDEDVKGALLRMCDFRSTEGTPITYPVEHKQSVKVTKKGFKWFMNNHYNANRAGNGKITKREELIFQQNAAFMTADSNQKLYVNKSDPRGNNLNIAEISAGVAADELREEDKTVNSRQQGASKRGGQENYNRNNPNGQNRSYQGGNRGKYQGSPNRDNSGKKNPNWNHP